MPRKPNKPDLESLRNVPTASLVRVLKGATIGFNEAMADAEKFARKIESAKAELAARRAVGQTAGKETVQ